MKPTWLAIAFVSTIAVAWPSARAQQFPTVAGDAQPSAASDVEVLTRGPVHEAFAEPIDLEARANIVAPQQPPEPINELQPEQRPDGDAVWISGYWAWDEERDDFIWVSGVWRIPPQGREWIDGRWERVDGEYHRSAGYWAPVNSEVVYLEQPPESLEQGPTGPAPGDDYFWVPGCWRWVDNNYAWRAGFWSLARSGWTWVPDHYQWANRGCTFVSGYWDYYPFAQRGWLFAPVYFGSGYRTGLSYRPNLAIDAAALALNLFVGPRGGGYYFGDYYGRSYLSAGYRPWYRFNWNRGYYDPIFAYNHWYYGRNQRGWIDRLDRRYDDLVRDEKARPPRVWQGDKFDRRGFNDRDRDRDFDDRRIARRIDELPRQTDRSRKSDPLERVVGPPPRERSRDDRARIADDRRDDQRQRERRDAITRDQREAERIRMDRDRARTTFDRDERRTAEQRARDSQRDLQLRTEQREVPREARRVPLDTDNRQQLDRRPQQRPQIQQRDNRRPESQQRREAEQRQGQRRAETQRDPRREIQREARRPTRETQRQPVIRDDGRGQSSVRREAQRSDASPRVQERRPQQVRPRATAPAQRREAPSASRSSPSRSAPAQRSPSVQRQRESPSGGAQRGSRGGGGNRSGGGDGKGGGKGKR